MQRFLLLAARTAQVLVLTLTSAALADDGRQELSPACALVGCFAGDSAGFPVVLTIPGSYVLTGNLAVTDPSADGILIQAPPIDGVVTIDLNGFTIAGPVTCSGLGSALACGEGAGVGISGPTQVVVSNGRVTGFGSGGIAVGSQSRVDGVIADANGGPGIVTELYSLVHHCIARQNEGAGIQVGAGSIVESSAAADNFANGITTAEGAVVKESTAYDNGAAGVSTAYGAQVEANSAQQNGGAGVVAGGAGTAVIDNTSYGNLFGGIFTGSGGMVSRNTVRSNGGTAISFGLTAAFDQNTISGTVFGGVNMGANSCNGTASCP